MTKSNNITGSIRPRPSKDNVRYYTIVLELGKEQGTGKRIRTSFRCDTTDRKEAEKFLLMKKAEYLKGEMLMPSDLTVEQYLDEYLDFCKGSDYSSATIRDYVNVIERYLKPIFGKTKLQDLQKVQIQQAYNKWRVKSNASDNPLKATTIQHINRVFKAALNEAVEREYIKQNPTHRIKIPKDTTTNKLDVYTVEEIRTLQKAVKGTDMELPVALLFDCVMRRGELLGLRYSDINFDTSTITIRHSLVESEDSKIPVLKDCKTDDSYREMVVSEYTMKLLRKQKTRYKQNKLKYGKDFQNNNYVICQEDGRPFLPKSFTRKWSRTLEIHGLRHIKLHGTRHSAISMLLSEGIPLHIVQQRAGHKDPQMTLSIYSHVARDKQNVVAEKLDSLIFSAANE
ncbi:MAG: tyrosine-type recombinase/integrase [Eubacterium sp.]|nr:tyrosine-type recombinase/integrase [Eubacterium sp.]